MIRDGYIVEQIATVPVVTEALEKTLTGKRRKRSREGRAILKNKEAVIASLIESISKAEFRIRSYRERDIFESGKMRRIQIIRRYLSIGVHAIMSVVGRHIRPRFIRTTSASIKGRGAVDLKEYIERDIRTDLAGTAYCYKFDIKKFYENVRQDTVINAVDMVFKDPKLRVMLENFIRLLPEGVSIGLRSSQDLCNLLLSIHLDHVLKDRYRLPYFYRYCDDGVILTGSKQELWKWREVVHECIENLGLEIKPNERIFPTANGIDYLGYVIYPDHSVLRKRNKVNFARRLGKVKSRKRRRELIASFYGMAKHAQCNNLFYKLTGKRMRSFKDLNVAYKPDDGKKRFPGAVVSIRELVNLPIVVRDFEVGVKTSQGEDRCVVAIEVNGEQKKFFTNSEEMKNILQQVSEMPDGFPFETTIKTEAFGKGKTKYVFT